MSPILNSLGSLAARAFGFFSAPAAVVNGPAGAFEALATVVADGTTTTITFTGIPSDYKHLQIRTCVQATGPSGAAVYGGWMRFNGDSGSNYSDHGIYPEGTTINAYSDVSSTNMGGILYTTADATNTLASTIVDILDYSNTSRYKTMRVFGGTDINTGAYAWGFASGNWRSTNAITSVTISINTGFGSYYITSGSKISLYGVR